MAAVLRRGLLTLNPSRRAFQLGVRSRFLSASHAATDEGDRRLVRRASDAVDLGETEIVKKQPFEATKDSFALLNNRGVIELSGVDTRDFLQGLVTNDVYKLDESNPEATAISASFLSPKGRMIAEVIIFRVADDVFLLDCSLSVLDDIIKLLKLYKLRKEVKVSNASETYYVWQVMSPGRLKEAGESLNTMAKATVVCEDPRSPSLGYRMLSSCYKSVHTEEVRKSLHKAKFQEVVPETWDLLRTLYGVPEGLEVRDKIPLELNIDYLNGVSFDKGCYTGQELVARTHHKGLVRKRLVPMRLNTSADATTEDSTDEDLLLPKWLRDISRTVKPADKATKSNENTLSFADDTETSKAPGRMLRADIRGSAGIGLCMLRLDDNGKVAQQSMQPGKLKFGDMQAWVPQLPPWWPQ